MLIAVRNCFSARKGKEENGKCPVQVIVFVVMAFVAQNPDNLVMAVIVL